VRPGSPGRRPNLLGELAVVLVLVKVYDQVRGQEAARAGPARRHGDGILAVERWLHLDVERAATHWLAAQPAVSLVAAWWYQLAHLSVTLAVLAWCWLRRPDAYRRLRTALVLTNVAGLLVFLVYPVMPPRLLPGGGYVDAVAAAGFGPPHAGPVAADQYAAMPSLHLAWATWVAAVGVTLLAGRRARWLCLLYPVLTAVVVVVTGNHYVLDVVAGVAVAVLALLAAPRLRIPHPRPRQSAPVGVASGR
jgi:membrane-associated phospholipid phosphatase